jgi:hypothetical protein
MRHDGWRSLILRGRGKTDIEQKQKGKKERERKGAVDDGRVSLFIYPSVGPTSEVILQYES